MTLPSFLVIGAYKSGTTALHHLLREHPGLFLPERKEPSYFAFAGEQPPFQHPAAASSVRDRSTYEALFAPARAGQVLGEVSPAYLSVAGAAERIRAELPDAHLIAVLRNPVERAYSDYLMYRRDGLEHETDFMRALAQQGQRDPTSDPTAHYITTGHYAEQIERFQHTFPAEQLHVLLHEDLLTDQRSALRSIFEFLDVDADAEVAEQTPSNVSGVPNRASLRLAYTLRRRLRSTLGPIVPEPLKRRVDSQLERRLDRPPMPGDARRHLQHVFHDDVERLSGLIGRDLSHWITP